MSRVDYSMNIEMLKLQRSYVTQHEKSEKKGSFRELFDTVSGNGTQNQEISASGVQFSRHAAMRVQQRGLEITETFMEKLNQAVDKAKEKGAKDVVVIGQQGSFIVNIPNNVVVTSFSGNELKENVFTNIDSAVIM